MPNSSVLPPISAQSQCQTCSLVTCDCAVTFFQDHFNDIVAQDIVNGHGFTQEEESGHGKGIFGFLLGAQALPSFPKKLVSHMGGSTEGALTKDSRQLMHLQT